MDKDLERRKLPCKRKAQEDVYKNQGLLDTCRLLRDTFRNMPRRRPAQKEKVIFLHSTKGALC